MVGRDIIKKCLDELGKEQPRKDYVIGMLETLYAFGHDEPESVPGRVVPVAPQVRTIGVAPNNDSFDMPLINATRIANAQKLSEESLQWRTG